MNTGHRNESHHLLICHNCIVVTHRENKSLINLWCYKTRLAEEYTYIWSSDINVPNE